MTSLGDPKVGRAATKLCRIAFELANQPDVISVANRALEGLLEATHVNAGAVLLVPRDFPGARFGQRSGSDRLTDQRRTSSTIACRASWPRW